MAKEIKENIDFEDLIKPGYFYQIGNKSGIIFITGRDGALNFVNKAKEKGMNDYLIMDMISITDDDGLKNNTIFHKLSEIKWQKR